MSMPEFQSEIQQPGQVARNVKRLITSLAYPRHGGVPVLWNRENGDSCVNFVRRDGSTAKACSARAKPTPTTPISKTPTPSGPLPPNHQNPPPPITFCTSVSASATTVWTTTLTATSYCSCNGGWMLGIGSTVGADHSTTTTCQAGPKATIAMHDGAWSD